MRLLLVEDNEELAQLLRQRLAAAGYETDLLTAAGEAQSALATTRYAAMVLDLGLPDATGSRSCARYASARIRFRFWCSPPAAACKIASAVCAAARMTIWSSRSRSRSCWPASKHFYVALASCSDARCKSPTSRSIPKVDRRSSMTSRRSSPRARRPCSKSSCVARTVWSPRSWLKITFSACPAMSPRMRSRSTSIGFANSCRSAAPRCKSIPFAASDTSFPRKRRRDFIQIDLLADHFLARDCAGDHRDCHAGGALLVLQMGGKRLARPSHARTGTAGRALPRVGGRWQLEAGSAARARGHLLASGRTLLLCGRRRHRPGSVFFAQGPIADIFRGSACLQCHVPGHATRECGHLRCQRRQGDGWTQGLGSGRRGSRTPGRHR